MIAKKVTGYWCTIRDPLTWWSETSEGTIPDMMKEMASRLTSWLIASIAGSLFMSPALAQDGLSWQRVGSNVVVDGTATSNSAAVYMSGSVGVITVTNSVFDVTGPTSAAFLVEDGGTASVSNSKISASGTGAPLGATLNSAIKVAGTLLSGGPVFVASGSTITCAGVHDENFSFFSSSCP